MLRIISFYRRCVFRRSFFFFNALKCNTLIIITTISLPSVGYPLDNYYCNFCFCVPIPGSKDRLMLSSPFLLLGAHNTSRAEQKRQHNNDARGCGDSPIRIFKDLYVCGNGGGKDAKSVLPV